jgi:CheY-like chemotaxis protein
MDINMPVMNGFESTLNILEYQEDRMKNKYPKCEIVALTAFMNKDYIDRCKKVGMKEVLNKPATSKTIRNTILKYCPFFKQRIGNNQDNSS